MQLKVIDQIGEGAEDEQQRPDPQVNAQRVLLTFGMRLIGTLMRLSEAAATSFILPLTTDKRTRR
jgi:hypothetical protein